MVREVKCEKSNRELIKTLLRQRAIERSVSLSWDRYSLMMVYSILIIIVFLELANASKILVAVVAALGLASLWMVASLQGKKIQKLLLEEEKQDFEEYFPGEDLDNLELTPSVRDQSVLSEKEIEVLSHIVTGSSNKQIADAMGITVHTTKNHITHIFNKLGVFDRTSLAILALNKGWVKELEGDKPESDDTPKTGSHAVCS